VIKLHRTLLAGAVLALAASSVNAAEVTGQLALGSLGTITSTGSDLASPTAVITIPAVQATQTGLINFSGITLGTVIDTDGAAIDVGDAANGFGFNLSGAAFGNFVADTGAIVTQTADFLNLYVEGKLTPGSGVVGDEGRASLNVTLTFINGVYGFAAVLNAPPTPVVPEPSSVALAGIGLASAGLFGLRKRYSK